MNFRSADPNRCAYDTLITSHNDVSSGEETDEKDVLVVEGSKEDVPSE